MGKEDSCAFAIDFLALIQGLQADAGFCQA